MKDRVASSSWLSSLGCFFRTRVFLLGLVIVLVVGLVFWGILTKEARDRATSTLNYIQEQSLSFDSYNNASQAKSVMRAIENAGQLARNIEEDGGVSRNNFEQYVSELRLTGALVLSPEGEVEEEYSTDGVGSSQLLDTITNKTALEVAQYPQKTYTGRVELNDRSYVDFACAYRLDERGIVVSLYHTDAEFANRYTLSLQSMLNGYSAADYGTIVIEKNNKIIASNKNNNGDTDAVGVDTRNENVVKTIKNTCEANEQKIVESNGALYLGEYGKARDFYVYTYTSALPIFGKVALACFAAIVLYASILGAFIFLRHRSESKHLAERIMTEHRYNKRLEEAAQEAQNANRAKTEFLQRMSHDLRTPINGIRGMVKVGDMCADDLVKQEECRQKIWDASGLLLDLVNEILDMSKLESGKINLDVQPLSISDTMRELYEIIERQASLSKIKIMHEPLKVEHPCIYASSIHLKRLLMNIMSNAVKYNKEGGEVHVSCCETAYTNGIGTYVFTIEDTGIGMSEEFKKHVFEPFAQEGRKGAGNREGTGLGMPIARSLCEIMNGTIEFDSKIDVGTTYVITLPFRVCGSERASFLCEEKEDKEIEEPLIEGVRVLLVEDNELNREIAQFLLESAGAQVVAAIDGQEAFETFKESEEGFFDAIIMDIMMPRMDGYEATRCIRALDRKDATKIPIVAMSANAFAEDRQNAREAGMDEHLVKPFDPSLMIRTIAKFVDERKSSKE